MTDDFDPSDHKPSSTDRDELPTAYGGQSHVEPQEPGQSLGQVPEPDDAGVDEAGDRPTESGSDQGIAEPDAAHEDRSEPDAAHEDR